MSRSIFIIITDFLLISLITLINFEQINQGLPSDAPRPDTGVEVQAVQDMLDVLKQALAGEQTSRSVLSNQLGQVQVDLQAQQRELAERDLRLRQTEQNLQAAAARSRQLEEERARLQAAQAAAAQQAAQLQTQQVEAQTLVQRLQQELMVATNETTATRASTAALQAELAARRDEVRRLQEQTAALQQTALNSQAEQGRLSGELKRVETQATLYRAQLDENRQQIAAVSEEKTRLQQHASTLAQGLDGLAQESAALATEIRNERQLSPNTIYTTWLQNRVNSSMDGARSTLFGTSRDTREAHVVLFRDGGHVFALYHLQWTLLPSWFGGPDWQELNATLSHGTAKVPVPALTLVTADPRVLIAPLADSAPTQLGIEAYAVAKDPAKYQDAVLVGGRDGYYGEVEFRLVSGQPFYVRMERRPLGKIFGKFSPTKGDLAFTKTGELLGLMVNSQYCALINGLNPLRVVRLGKDIARQPTSEIGADVGHRIQGMPIGLQ